MWVKFDRILYDYEQLYENFKFNLNLHFKIHLLTK